MDASQSSSSFLHYLFQGNIALQISMKLKNEKDSFKLCALYAKAADATCDVNTACFLATQAYVFGLQSNHPFVGRLHAFLKKHGREE